MNRFHAFALIALSFAITFVGCLAVPESESAPEAPPVESMSVSSGPGQCSGGSGQSCTISTDGGVVQGTCVGESCCGGCAFRGACVTGNTDTACGTGGLTCDTCSTVEDCVLGSCVPACSSPAECDTHCVGKPTGYPCDLCNVLGQCYQNQCYPSAGQPFPSC